MRRVLEDEEYQVSILQEGRETLVKTRQLQPDLLILDLKLGDVSGKDILTHLKTDDTTADIPIIVYTAAVLEADDVASLIERDPQRYSGVCLLRKPFELTTLLDKVEELLDKNGQTGH